MLAAAPGPAMAAPDFAARTIVHAMEYPWSALGRVNAGGRGHCTGALISERHVLTQADCLFYDVEGRWWSPQELHFVAGYQRDSYRIHAAVAAYRIAAGYRGGKGMTLANLTHNWALLTLEEPLGRRAGWLAMDWLTARTRSLLVQGRAFVLDAGYRPGQSHVVTVRLSCGFDSPIRRQMQIDGQCGRLTPETGLSRLLFRNGSFRLLGTPSMGSDPGLTRIHRDGRGKTPSAPSPAQPVPYQTIQALLHDLGYLGTRQLGQKGPLRQAIRAYQSDRGLAATGHPTVALLGHLLSNGTGRASGQEVAAGTAH